MSDINYCLKPSQGNTFSDYTSDGSSFGLEATNNNGTAYHIISNNSPKVGALTLAVIDPANWMQIGTQVWARYNLNVGTRINGASNQTNNGGTNIVEKYCYNDLESNCTTYGGLYQWDEAMAYSTTNGAQGICPVGTHIPSDNDWKILEIHLGMTQAEADATGWRGTDQGTQIIPGGISGLNVLYAGYRRTGELFNGLNGNVNMWSSTQSGITAYNRHLDITNNGIDRSLNNKVDGFPVRCVGN